MISGYEDDPLVAGEGLLSRPAFWAAYLMWMCETDDEDGEPAAEWFGADEADVDAAYAELVDEGQWPVFRVPFGGGHSAVVVNRNFPEDEGTEYFVTHPEWGRRHGALATLDGHQAGPGLSWRELVHIANSVPSDAHDPGIHDPYARLLLLLPALGDEDLPADAVERVSQALVSVAGAPAGEATHVAQRLLLDHPLWEPARWEIPGPSPLSGGGAPLCDGILQCDGYLSPRYGMRLAQGITAEQSERLARALGTWSAGGPAPGSR
ncbi:hypothetical protein [Streptomyces sp. NBC_01320]|uniref:hypothetical protein n=1 Tax=Streptomyces sp. NBC_01320 TaxID=2903824 RepID=UPI002E1384FE|nr:hypothetical protein OG395_26605 [Streptomyces sp. NBC_01320]